MPKPKTPKKGVKPTKPTKAAPAEETPSAEAPKQTYTGRLPTYSR